LSKVAGLANLKLIMKCLIALLFACIVSCGFAADGRKASVVARSVYYPDGSHTECQQDLVLREQTETTYTKQGIKTAKKVYLLNEQGLPVQGNIYDGKDQLKARAQFLFDSFDRLSEQRMFNLQGEVFQRIVFSYDSKGRQLAPKSYNYNAKAPEMKQAPLDFTRPQGQAPRYDRSQGEQSNQPQGNVPFLPQGAMGAGSSGLPPTGQEVVPQTKDAGKAKEWFFKKLFGKKPSDAKK
jgi:hypothetical protein